MRIGHYLLAAALILPILASGIGYAGALADPKVRRERISLAGWPAGARPVRILLFSDVHVIGPDMPPSRLRRIVERMNALLPDLVVIAGDYVGDKTLSTRRYPLAEALAPLGGLRAPLGRYAVLGNHDHWRNSAAARRAVEAAGLRLLSNEAVQAGPIALGGLDDIVTKRADLPATLAQMRALRGARVLLTHSPDPFAQVPADVRLVLAGHTHCGQIVLPVIGYLATASDFGERYACGIVREGGKTLVVTSGLGTSVLPLRFGARPDMWLIEVGPRPGEAPAARSPARPSGTEGRVPAEGREAEAPSTAPRP